MTISSRGETAVEIKTKQSNIILSDRQGQSSVNGINIGPGEYGIADVEVRGVGENTFIVRVGDLNLVYFGGAASLSQNQIDDLGSVNVLITTINQQKTINDIDPNVIIPIWEAKKDLCASQPCPEAAALFKVNPKEFGEQRKIVILKSS